MRYICPVCSRPYTPTRANAFPKHGRRWVNGTKGKPSGWQHCGGTGILLNEHSKKHEPREPSRDR